MMEGDRIRIQAEPTMNPLVRCWIMCAILSKWSDLQRAGELYSEQVGKTREYEEQD